jgi:polygalacturonase
MVCGLRFALGAAVAGIVGVGAVAAAQDMRVVKEPKIPAACVVLQAGMTVAQATGGEVEAKAEAAGLGQGALDTARIQAALDRCGKGMAVELAADGEKAAFLTGPIQLRAGVVLLVDKGVTLYGTRNPEYYAVTPGRCGVVNDDSASGCRPMIAVVNATGAGILGDGVIDGQGGARLMVDGKATAKSWWDLAEDARTAGRQQVPRMIDTDLSDDFTLYRITLRNSANFHVAFHRGDGLTVWGVKIDTPKTARNTDGIDPAQARNITVTQSYIRTGDDNIALKAGDGPTTNVSIVHNHFYWGHGVSIGSETNGGVSAVRVTDLTLDGPDNGIRIKSNASRGGLVEDVVYEDVCVRDSKNPIFFDTTYTFPGKGVGMIPVYRDITLRDVRISGGGRIQLNGFDATHRIGVTLEGVVALDAVKGYKAAAIHTDLTLGPGAMNFVFTGDDSTVTGKAGSGAAAGCVGKFVGFP